MGYDYALVHIKYTVPPAILLTFLYRPLHTKIDYYKVLFLITVAVTATIPWDSYLIQKRIWSYPDYAVVGPTVFQIPLEELFFFVIQTYNTSLLYLLMSKPTFGPIYLKPERRDAGKGTTLRLLYLAGQVMVALGISGAMRLLQVGGVGTYFGLIVVWAFPVMLFLWTIGFQFIIGLPTMYNVFLPIALPTVYLWIVDTFALRRGTWVIETGTKLGFQLWNGLEIEEALFFLITNMMIVFGQVAFDNALAVADTFPSIFPHVGSLPSPLLLLKACFLRRSEYDADRVEGLRSAIVRLSKKSRSFYIASSVFNRRLRIDLVVLYSFCRVADDLVDDAPTADEAIAWINKLYKFLDISYSSTEKGSPSNRNANIAHYVRTNFPPETHFALLQLPTDYLSRQPLDDLLKGFEMDVAFDKPRYTPSGEPIPVIRTEKDLSLYAARVAGTVASLCLELVFHHEEDLFLTDAHRTYLINAGETMGRALQYVNISRDIAVDAAMNRVYIPSDWLLDEGLTQQDIINNPNGAAVERMRQRLLDRAFEMYGTARPAIEEIPGEGRRGMRVAVESYMEIGRVLRERGMQGKRDGEKEKMVEAPGGQTAGRATVPKMRRIWTAWKALSRG